MASIEVYCSRQAQQRVKEDLRATGLAEDAFSTRRGVLRVDLRDMPVETAQAVMGRVTKILVETSELDAGVQPPLFWTV